jgi:hypothetical protein
MEDNWRGRTTGMICGTCVFFVEKFTSCVQRSHHSIGRCRANAPTLKGWPVVFSDDWCGNHKLNENKIDVIDKTETLDKTDNMSNPYPNVKYATDK